MKQKQIDEGLLDPFSGKPTKKPLEKPSQIIERRDNCSTDTAREDIQAALKKLKIERTPIPGSMSNLCGGNFPSTQIHKQKKIVHQNPFETYKKELTTRVEDSHNKGNSNQTHFSVGNKDQCVLSKNNPAAMTYNKFNLPVPSHLQNMPQTDCNKKDKNSSSNNANRPKKTISHYPFDKLKAEDNHNKSGSNSTYKMFNLSGTPHIQQESDINKKDKKMLDELIGDKNIIKRSKVNESNNNSTHNDNNNTKQNGELESLKKKLKETIEVVDLIENELSQKDEQYHQNENNINNGIVGDNSI